MKEITWSAPNTIPAGMSDTTYRSILNRNNPVNPPCERFASGECSIPCQTADQDGTIKVEFSHRQAKSMGGEMDASNIFLECACENRKRGAAPDPIFNMPSPFDEPFDYSNLRRSQQLVTYEIDAVRPLWTEHLHKIRDICLLIVATTGAGKGMAIVAALHRISEIVMRDAAPGYRRRPMNVIWFAPERSLATALKNEIMLEPVKFGMRETEIQTYDAGEGNFNLNKTMPRPGIVFACPQFFWKVDNRDRSDADVTQILSNYDTIIWDECDFAEEQLARLCRLAPHAFKFGLTATPIKGSGQFLNRFAVGPVIDYQTVKVMDNCLKLFERGVNEGISPNIILSSTGHYRSSVGKEETDREGCSNDNESLRGNIATIRRAIIDSDEIETRMRSIDRKGYYSPHIIIRTNSVSQAEDLFMQVSNMLPNMNLQNQGWGVCMMHGRLKDYPVGNGRRVKVPKDEIRLGNTKDHPWFLAKHNDGKATKKSKRILIVVDMGIRGLNNWPCLSAVDLTNTTSLVELIQFMLTGRIGRWPANKAEWINSPNKGLKEFISGRIYLPKDVDHEKVVAVGNALSFQLDMVRLVKDSNMRTWMSLIDDQVSESKAAITDTENPFSEEDKLQIEVLINQHCERVDCEPDVIDDDGIELIIDQLPPKVTGERLEKARKHAKEIARDPEARQERIAKINRPVSPLPVVVYEAPKEPSQYSVAELAEWGSVYYSYTPSEMEKEINSSSLIRDVIAKTKNRDDKRLYVAPVMMNNLHGDGGLLRAIASKYANEWVARGIIRFERRHEVFIAVNAASKEVFGLDDVSHESKLNTPEYQHKLQGIEASRRIKNRTISLLIKFGAISVGRLYDH